MSKQPTNGPYHWGNGPQPKGSGSASRKFVVIIAAMYLIVPLTLIFGFVAVHVSQ
jgi:hypothetical protein